MPTDLVSPGASDVELAVAIAIVVINIVGILLVVVGLPGIWMMIAMAAGVNVWGPELFSWWTIGACVVLALLSEIADLVAAAGGSKVGGGGRRSGAFALIGGLVGAVVGAPFPPLIGAILWGVIGAGVGAILGELSCDRGWKQSMAVGGAAATGRLVGTIVKLATAMAIWVIIAVAAFVP